MLVDVDLEFVASEMVRESAMPFSRPDRALQRAIYRSILPADEAVFERARQIEARERDGFRGVASEEERLRIREVNQAVWAEAKPVATWQSSLLAKAYEVRELTLTCACRAELIGLPSRRLLSASTRSSNRKSSARLAKLVAWLRARSRRRSTQGERRRRCARYQVALLQGPKRFVPLTATSARA